MGVLRINTPLLYLASLYWGWREFKIVVVTTNIEVNAEKLEKTIPVLTKPVLEYKSIFVCK